MTTKHKLIIENLQSKNRKFNLLVKQIGDLDLKKKKLNFESLIKIIINQQLSNHVANIIFLRLKNKLLKSKEISPSSIININKKTLRDLGISFSKISFMKETAKYLVKNPYFENKLKTQNDDEAKQEIQKLKGFGPWSANIILLFYMGRNDIFPHNDATLQKAYYKIYGEKLSKSLLEINWARPYRSIFARYLWRWVDNGMIPLDD